MGTFNSSKTVPRVVEDLAPVAQDVMGHFESQDYEVTETHIPTGGCRSASAAEAPSRPS
jgi:hypothetical protein